MYDALNVLMAMDIIAKHKKEILWRGLPHNQTTALERLRGDRARLASHINKQRAYIQVSGLGGPAWLAHTRPVQSLISVLGEQDIAWCDQLRRLSNMTPAILNVSKAWMASCHPEMDPLTKKSPYLLWPCQALCRHMRLPVISPVLTPSTGSGTSPPAVSAAVMLMARTAVSVEVGLVPPAGFVTCCWSFNCLIKHRVAEGGAQTCMQRHCRRCSSRLFARGTEGQGRCNIGAAV